jgi:hypothetical protein
MRYGFSLLRGYVWRDMIYKPKYFWGMWGVKRTLTYIIKDTLHELREGKA